MFAGETASLGYLILWGLIATVVMTSILEGSRGLGFSRMSLPFLLGTFFTANRRWALIVGFVVYTVGGWLFDFLYFFIKVWTARNLYLFILVNYSCKAEHPIIINNNLSAH